MDEGISWSGHERNCAYLNVSGSDFADISAVSGLDFDDDGRAAAVLDWDGDGDLDVVLKNRTGPQLRILRNDCDPPPALLIELRDAGVNRDAIGARVEVHVGSRRMWRIVTAGDGYLSQASRRLHFGLAATDVVTKVIVRWPDGTDETFTPPATRGHHLASRGSGNLTPVPRPTSNEPLRSAVAGDHALAPATSLPALDVVVLREPLLLPPTLARAAFRGPPTRPALLGFWAEWCIPCVEEISRLATSHAELRAADVDVVLLGMDEPSDQARAALRFQSLLQPHPGASSVLRQRPASPAMRLAIAALLEVTVGRTDIPLPVSFLVDASGKIQIITFGATSPEQVLEEARKFGKGDLPGSLRTARGGRWLFEIPRVLPKVAEAFRTRGLREDAAVYDRLAARPTTAPR